MTAIPCGVNLVFIVTIQGYQPAGINIGTCDWSAERRAVPKWRKTRQFENEPLVASVSRLDHRKTSNGKARKPRWTRQSTYRRRHLSERPCPSSIERGRHHWQRPMKYSC